MVSDQMVTLVTHKILLHLIETNFFEKVSLDRLVKNALSGDFEGDSANQLIQV